MISFTFFGGTFLGVILNDFFFTKSIKCLPRKSKNKTLGKVSSFRNLIKKKDHDKQVEIKFEKSKNQLLFEQFTKDMNQFAKNRKINLDATI